MSCSENGELDLAQLGPVTNLAELGCDKQYRWMMMVMTVTKITFMMKAAMTKRMKSSTWFALLVTRLVLSLGVEFTIIIS